MISPDADAFRHMHDTASQYHLHYSTVRTLASALYLSFGLLASVELFIDRAQAGCAFPIVFLLLIYVTTLIFNVIFARWSRACRQIERYYETKMAAASSYVVDHGFRHLFPRIILSRQGAETSADDLPASLDWTWRHSTDPFFTGILAFGFIYIVIYSLFLCLS